MKKPYRILAGLVIGGYFVIGVMTLGSYGVNWDEVSHSTRGQAYLYYFLTGKKQYDESLFAGKYSFYQIQQFNFVKQMSIDGDHPVLSDVLSSLFNVVFYQKLGLFGDLESYHLYGVVLVGLFLVFLYWWVEKYYGGFAGLVTIISLVTYPLFYGESHFNVQKDIPEAVYRTLTALLFYEALRRKSPKWMIATGIAFGFALGTKLNVIFLFPIFVLYIFLIRKSIPEPKTRLRLFLYALFSLCVGLAIYIGSWPWLWQDPIGNIGRSLGYYQRMGILPAPDLSPDYYIGFIKTYAIQWIVYTTPLVTLFLTSTGVIISLRASLGERYRTGLYVFLLLITPIARVSLANASIYGGVRQIMEYIPPMAILSGIGAKYLLDRFKAYRFLVQIVIIASFIPITAKMISMHPNESVYFNPLIGGLGGAARKNIPGWGNSLGSTYRQGVGWLNKNALPNAKLATIYELRSNVPLVDLRGDIDFQNLYRSGPARRGEYIIGVTHQGTREKSYHRKYLDRFLVPVYEVKIDDIPILKVWKNDLAHTRAEYRDEKTMPVIRVEQKIERNELFVDLEEARPVTKLDIRYSWRALCAPPALANIMHSPDGKTWEREFINLSSSPIAALSPMPEPGVFQFLLAADLARYIRILTQDDNSCLITQPVRVFVNYLLL